MTEQDLIDFGFKYIGEDTHIKSSIGQDEPAHPKHFRLDRPERYDCILLSIFPYQFKMHKVEHIERNEIDVRDRVFNAAYRECADMAYSSMYNIKVSNISDLSLAIELLS